MTLRERECVCVCVAEQQKEVTRSEMTSLRLSLTQQTFEKDTVHKSCCDLRCQVKRLEAQKAELSRVLHEQQQKISGAHFCTPCSSINVLKLVNERI